MSECAERRPSPVAIVVISVVFLIYVWDRVVVPIEAVEIRTALHLTLPQTGLLGSVFTFGLMLAAVPSGLFAARYGTRASLLIGSAIFSVGTLCFGLTEWFGLQVFLRILSGIGEGFYNVSLLSFLGRMTRRYRALAVGFPATLFGLGVFTGPPVVLTLQNTTGAWWLPFVILGVAVLVGAAAPFALLRANDAAHRAERGSVSLSRIAAVLTPGTIAIYATIAATGVIVYSYLSLLQGYLRAESGLSPAASSTVFSLFGIGSAIGGIGMGFLGDSVRRGRFITIGTVIVALVGACVFWATPSLAVSGALSLAIGAGTNGIYVNGIALVQDRAGHDNVPVATGLLAVIYYFMSAFSGYIVAKLAAGVGWGTTGLLAYAVPYLVIAPFLLRLVWQRGVNAERGMHSALYERGPR